jgi:hypothetical protein
MVVDILRHVGSDGRDIDHILLVGPLLIHLAAAVGARAQGHVDLDIHMVGDRPLRRRVPRLAPRLLRVGVALV